ncbi:LysR family transcriptional regulator [Streptomyces sp. NPDC048337]|uniref:LysR family transcriptional regulator n=1 Tax=Streptomyces sp. NPDC048337 TaxID=3365535 RepID=UPI0037104FF0
MIDVQRLRVLRAVAEHGSFNKAAGAPLLTPSAVSQHIASLERTVGHPVAVVRAGVADLALTHHFDGPPPVRPGGRPELDWTPLMEDPLRLVLPRGHRLTGRSSIGPAELSADRWVLGCLKTETFLRRYREPAGFDLVVGASTTDHFFGQTPVAAGVGVSLVPHVAPAPGPGPAVIRVEPPCPARHIGVVVPRRRRPHPYADALTGALTAAAASAGDGVRP